MPRKQYSLCFDDLPIELVVIILHQAAQQGGIFTSVALLYVCHDWYDTRTLWLPAVPMVIDGLWPYGILAQGR